MSVESKVFVTCGKEKTTEVGNAVAKALNSWLRSKLKFHIAESGAVSSFAFFNDENYDSSRWTNGLSIESYNFDVLSFIFGCGDGGEGSAKGRVLHFFPDCSSDYSDIFDGEKLIFSLDQWGSHKEIMSIVIEAIEPFGRVFYCENNSIGEFKEIK